MIKRTIYIIFFLILIGIFTRVLFLSKKGEVKDLSIVKNLIESKLSDEELKKEI